MSDPKIPSAAEVQARLFAERVAEQITGRACDACTGCEARRDVLEREVLPIFAKAVAAEKLAAALQMRSGRKKTRAVRAALSEYAATLAKEEKA